MNRTTTVLFALTVLAVLASTTARAEDKELRISVWLDKDQRPYWDTQDEKKLKQIGAKKSRSFRKLIVASKAVIYHPGNPGAPGTKVSLMDIFHQLKTDDDKERVDRGGKRYLRVGRSDGVAAGWLEVKMPTKPEERLSPDVAIWGTRLLLDPREPRPGDESFTVFQDPECKRKLAVLRRMALSHRNFAPILRRVGKEADHLFEVAFFSGEVKSTKKEIPIYQIVGAISGQPKGLMTGYAATISAHGNTVAKIRVFVEKGELDRVRSTFDFLHTQFKRMVNPESRKNLKTLVEILKHVTATSVAGQDLQLNTEIQDLITDLPLNTNVLKISTEILSKMDRTAFEKWLKELASSRRNAARLLEEESVWRPMPDSVFKEAFGYIRWSDMP